ncbi:MAG TPA: hypothetical protein VKQ36_06350, partial [Ktedonobacterales bacterium]|nr:hypothetical protein [Ktedonobacterales bacterium]
MSNPDTTPGAQSQLPPGVSVSLRILALNGGSSSLKFALYRLTRQVAPISGDPHATQETLELAGALTDIGGQESAFTLSNAAGTTLL